MVLSYVFGIVLKSFKLYLRENFWICWVIKGLELEIGCLLKDVVYDVIGDYYLLVVLFGLMFVKELVMGMFIVIFVVLFDE